MIHKTGTNFVMRRYEDYSCWSRCLRLVNWMTKHWAESLKKK